MVLPYVIYIPDESTGNRRRSLEGKRVRTVDGAEWHDRVEDAFPASVLERAGGLSVMLVRVNNSRRVRMVLPRVEHVFRRVCSRSELG